MTPHLVVRVDGDTFAVAHRGDLRDSMSRAMDAALPDPGSTVHAAIVDASDAGAARLLLVPYWIGVDDTDPDTVHETARTLGIQALITDVWVATVTAVASALVDALRLYETCADCDGSTAVGTPDPHVCGVPAHEHDDYIRTVAMSADAARRFLGRIDEPDDLGPPVDADRYKPGARVWGFRVRP